MATEYGSQRCEYERFRATTGCAICWGASSAIPPNPHEAHPADGLRDQAGAPQHPDVSPAVPNGIPSGPQDGIGPSQRRRSPRSGDFHPTCHMADLTCTASALGITLRDASPECDPRIGGAVVARKGSLRASIPRGNVLPTPGFRLCPPQWKAPSAAKGVTGRQDPAPRQVLATAARGGTPHLSVGTFIARLRCAPRGGPCAAEPGLSGDPRRSAGGLDQTQPRYPEILLIEQPTFVQWSNQRALD